MSHSKVVGGSTAKRVMSCPASVKLCQKMPPQAENEYMAKGTLCHMGADAVVGTSNPRKCIGLQYNGMVLTEEIYEDKIEPALALFDQIDPDMQMEFVTETQVGFGDFLPGVFGTADFIGRLGSTAIIGDWKFGDGVLVSAEENAQGLFYGAAARRTPKLKWAFDGAKQLEIIIIQPPRISRWVCPIERLDAFEIELKAAVEKSERDDAPLNAGEWCRFCAAKPICPKMTGAVDRALQTDLKSLDVKYINNYLKNAEILEQWITDLRALAYRMMDEGDIKFPDWKLVAKRATRKWAEDPKVVEAALRELGINPLAPAELLSPAQAEKALKKVKKNLPDDMVVALSSGNTLAPKDDPRPEVLNIGRQLTAALSKIG
jgi:hypothetical protein